MHTLSTGPETWKEIAVAQRKWANLNPQAIMYDRPMTYADYYQSKWVIDPFYFFNVRINYLCLLSELCGEIVPGFSECSLGKSLAAQQHRHRGGKFIFQIVARSVVIIFCPIIAQLMHPEIRFWWCCGPFYGWPVKKINIPGHVSFPTHAIGNGFADGFITVVKMFDSIIA